MLRYLTKIRFFARVVDLANIKAKKESLEYFCKGCLIR